MIPNNISKEHIKKAILEIDNNGIEKGAHSSTYDVLHDGKRYPPKLVISLANKYANGEILPRDTFSGGPSHPAFKLLDKLGFTIIQKNDSKEAFIDLKEEFANWLLENAPESYKKMYLGYTQESILEKLVEIDGFFNDLNLYLVNKENVLEIIELIKSRISRAGRANNPDFEKYDAGKGSGIPKAVIGKKNYFKFLDEKFQKGQTNYWVFQGNPKIYDINSALRQGHVKIWKVAAHKESIKPGDKVILWQTGDEAGCYALGKVISEVGKIREEEDELQYYLVPSVSNDTNDTERVQLEIITNLVERPILWSLIKDNPVFENFKAGNQGTNFSATEKEFKTLAKMVDTVRFSWVETHKQLAQYLVDKQDQQKELIALLKKAGATEFNDKDSEDRIIDLEEIDPFTFFCYIYKYGPKKRLKILQNIAKELNFTVPIDESGVPSSNAQKVWLFPFKQLRNNNEIDRLWQLFKNGLGNSITNEEFADVLTIYNTGKTVLTEGLFNINPEQFLPINRPTKPYITEKFGIDTEFDTYSEYLEILNKIKAKTSTPFYQISYEAWLWNNQPKKDNSTAKNKNTMETPLNQLFYGPPGTGKTYGTIAEAIKVVDQDFYMANKNNRKLLTKRYQELLITDWKEATGQIGFCTFHQSFTYEDFVEGIKPQITQEKNVYYDIIPGIFKKICELADSSQSASKVKKEGKVSWNDEQFRRAFFYKLSLGEANNPEDREIYEFCIKNNYIAIGFGGDHDYKGMSETQIKEKCEELDGNSSSGSQLSTFIHGLSQNNYVLISKGNQFVRALGKVVGDYEYHDDFPIRYSHFRKVEWLFVDENIPIENLYDTTLTQRTIYKIDHDKLKKDFFVSDNAVLESLEKEVKPYVLIIDEINRGNVASIFGELITLIETDKRAGAVEELQVLLPYSKEKFSVPNNVYIIGTMNTADRSIEALDSALRRRFSFREIKPNPATIDEVLQDKAIWYSVSLSEILKTINNRITVLIDRDHQIGHSYFLKLNEVEEPDLGQALKSVFSNNIIPLLQEYFFNDFVKIGMILGSGFIKVSATNDKLFAEIEDSLGDDYSDVKEYEFANLEVLDDNQFKSILNTLLNH